MSQPPVTANQVTAPQSGKAGPDRELRIEREEGKPEESPDLNPVGMLDGQLRTHDSQTSHPGNNLYPTGPGGSRQDVGDDVNSEEFNESKKAEDAAAVARKK